MTEDIVRVLRVIEYVGPRSRVEKTLATSIKGLKDAGNGLTIRAATIGDYPDILRFREVEPGEKVKVTPHE